MFFVVHVGDMRILKSTLVSDNAKSLIPHHLKIRKKKQDPASILDPMCFAIKTEPWIRVILEDNFSFPEEMEAFPAGT